MWKEFLGAVALVLVLEGILPFLNPSAWRQTVLFIVQQTNQALRKMGLISMLAGVLLLYLVH